MTDDASRCPLCGNTPLEAYHADRRRSYQYCPVCHLVSVPQCDHLPLDAEKREYLKHENHPEDQGYRRFLNRVCAPLHARMPAHSKGLDFGCGPGPTLSVMMQELGHTVAVYDPFFAAYPQVFEHSYTFITATEVVEHLRTPGPTLDMIWNCLEPLGWLALQTKRIRDATAFKSWHYIQDPTHISFFDARTFEWLAQQWNTTAQFIDHDVVFFQKPSRALPAQAF